MRAVLQIRQQQKCHCEAAKRSRQSRMLDCFAVLVMTALLVIVTNVAHAQCTPPSDGLIAHWKLDETSGTAATDSAGGFNGTMQGGLSGASDSVTGMLGNALQFNGTSDYISRADDPALDARNYMTASVWFYVNSAAYSKLLVKSHTASPWIGWEMYLTASNEVALQFANTAAGYFSVGSAALNTGQWYHAVGINDGGTLKLYINGVAAEAWNTGPITGTLQDGNYLFLIGAEAAPGDFFNGIIDDVRIYDRALSAAEVAALYASRSTVDAPAGQVVYDAKHSRLMYCNGTDWAHAGIGSYNSNAVRTSTAADFLELNSAFASVSDGKTFTGSFWANVDSLTQHNVVLQSNTLSPFKVTLTNTGNFRLLAHDPGGTERVNIWSDAIGALGWHHVLFSIDLDDINKRHIYIDGVEASNFDVTYSSGGGDLDFTYSQWRLTGQPGGGQDFIGALSDVWFDFNAYIDLSLESNRQKFISPNGMPAYLGADGSLPTGSKPDIFLSGDTVTFASNRGSGGGFTVNGALSTASSQPGDSVMGQPDGGDGYFVLIGNGPSNQESSEFQGDLGGLTGANATCLSYLQTYDWLGKSDAESRNLLSSSSVKAWLCDDAACQDMLPNTTYAFATAQTGMAANGGATFTTDGSGFYPTADTNTWDGATYFNRATDFYTGRDFDFSAEGTSCSNWSSNSSGVSGGIGQTIASNEFRWDLGPHNTCDTTDQYICFVNPVPGCGEAGTMQYNLDFNVMSYCNGVEWVAMGPVGGTPPTNGLVGHWALDEASGTTASDSSGNGNDGTLTYMDAPNDWVTGTINNGLDFDGTDDCVALGNQVEHDFSGGDSSISLWVKFNEHSGTYLNIVDRYTGTNGYVLFSRGTGLSSPGTLRYTFQAVTENLDAATTERVDDGQWHHIVALVDTTTTTGKIYVDGVLAGTDTYTGALTNDTSGMTFMASNANNCGAGTASYVNGVLDDVRFYNRALTEAEISQLYHYGLSRGLGDTSGNCANPSQPEGSMVYNADYNVLQYCNGEQWIGVGQ